MTARTSPVLALRMAKLKEREFLLTLAIAAVIVANALFDLGIDIQHLLGLVGLGGLYGVSRGLAKQGATAALPATERAHEAAKGLAGDD